MLVNNNTRFINSVTCVMKRFLTIESWHNWFQESKYSNVWKPWVHDYNNSKMIAVCAHYYCENLNTLMCSYNDISRQVSPWNYQHNQIVITHDLSINQYLNYNSRCSNLTQSYQTHKVTCLNHTPSVHE